MGAKKVLGRDEAQRLEEHKKQRRTGRRKKPPRRREWRDADEDELDDFEPIARAARLGDVAVGRDVVEVRAGEHGLARATVVAVHGVRARLLLGEDGGGAEVVADVAADLAAGGLVVGDHVAVESPEPDRLRVVAREERHTVLERRDPRNPRASRAIAANVDLGVIVLPAGPGLLRPGLVDRVWLALLRAEVEPLLVLNKVDLVPALGREAEVATLTDGYLAAGLDVVRASAETGAGVDDVRRRIAGRTVVFVGHSGAGKTSLLNRLDPGHARSVRDVRAADGKGRHTTTVSGLWELDDGTRLVDTPGIRSFGLEAASEEDLLTVFADLLEGEPCRFGDCRHDGVEGCAVAGRAAGDVRLTARLAAYRRLVESLHEDEA